MKKLLALFSIVLTLLAFTGCNDTAEPSKNSAIKIDTQNAHYIFINLDNITIYNSKLKQRLTTALQNQGHTIVQSIDESSVFIDLTIQSCQKYSSGDDRSILDKVTSSTRISAGSGGVSAGVSIGAGLSTIASLFSGSTTWTMKVNTIIDGQHTVLDAQTKQNSQSLETVISELENKIIDQLLATFRP
ncbi:MAG: hypothetical protein U9N30_00310 [Campylobacterota bacterium]|nr:hypothetical protein [Campylobacterota bacterium]